MTGPALGFVDGNDSVCHCRISPFWRKGRLVPAAISVISGSPAPSGSPRSGHELAAGLSIKEENIEALAEIFETNDVFTVEEMIVNLMN